MVENDLTPITGNNGEVVRLLGNCVDITAQKRAEQQYRGVVDNIRDVIFRVDEEGSWQFLNPA